MAFNKSACTVPRCDLRLAKDGYAYKESEFQEWYPSEWREEWKLAKELPLTHSVPHGLKLGKVEKTLVESVLHELSPYIPKKEDRSPHRRTAVEFGWTYEGSYDAEPGWGHVRPEGEGSFAAVWLSAAT